MTVRYDAQVSDLAGGAEPATHELAVDDHAAADAGPDGDQQQLVGVNGRAVAELAPRGRVGVVLDHDRDLELLLEEVAERQVAPRKVGGEEHGGAVGADEARG